MFVPSLRGGGAERVMSNLACGLAERGCKVDLVLARAEGPYLTELPPEVRIVDLKVPRVLASLPGLVRYLRRERPKALLSAMDHANVMALWAKRISGVSTRLVVSIHNTASLASKNARQSKARLLPQLARRFYPWADGIVAVSQGVADDFARITSLPWERIEVIYNPVITPELLEKAKEPVEHPWFGAGHPPVILGVGRLTKQKDFPTLIRAFAVVRKQRPVRLMILGEGEERPRLEALVKELGLGADAVLPGFVANPYAYMARAAVFVLSSAWEGFGNVLVEAMACGCPVVSTDCPSGPAEIMENGKYGTLVPVGDIGELAKGIVEVLDMPPDPTALHLRADLFSVNRITDKYLEVLCDS